MNGIEAVLDQIAANVPSYFVDGDYYSDGILYCGKCREPKQCEITFDGRTKVVPCVCPCKVAEMEQEEHKRKQAEFMANVEKTRREGFAESDMIKNTFEADDGTNEKVTTAARRYVDNFAEFKAQNKGLLFYGTVGTGKTFYAACIANALIDKGYTALMTNFARLSNTLQGMYEGKQKYIDSLNKFDLLIVDDLGTERKSEYMQELVFSIIDNRYRAGLPLIITTNLTMAELKSPQNIMENRIYDRVLERCFPLEVAGQSHRRKNVIDDYEETKKLLGL